MLTKQLNMKFTLFLATIGSARAFTQSNVRVPTRIAPLAATNDDGNGEMSRALPFVPRPKLLDGTLAGDVGFDPFNFAGSDRESLLYMREAEIKHSRLAMLSVVGWPLAELWDKKIAALIGLEDSLTSTGSSPSVLNGGLDKIEPEYWFLVLAIAAFFENESRAAQEEKKGKYMPGDCNFDPLGLMPKSDADRFSMQTKEIKHGRLAMMAILGFVVQEALYSVPVTSETPFFFQPLL